MKADVEARLQQKGQTATESRNGNIIHLKV